MQPIRQCIPVTYVPVNCWFNRPTTFSLKEKPEETIKIYIREHKEKVPSESFIESHKSLQVPDPEPSFKRDTSQKHIMNEAVHLAKRRGTHDVTKASIYNL